MEAISHDYPLCSNKKRAFDKESKEEEKSFFVLFLSQPGLLEDNEPKHMAQMT